MSAYTVGLTGGLAAGKSTVARLLAARGFTVVDADRLVAESYRPGGEGAAAVERLFGRELLDAEGAVERERLAARVFADADARRRLEAAIHPLVRRRFRRLAAARDGVLVLEAALLVEAGYDGDFDLLVTVEAPLETRLARAVARGAGEAEARARVAAQARSDARVAAADRVLENGGTLGELADRVTRLADEIEDLAAARRQPG